MIQPKTYLIGYTTINEEGLLEYLKDTNQEEFYSFYLEAKEKGLSSGEILCSFYAKLCYKSLVLGKNLNISKIRDIEDNIKGCFTTKHGSIFEHFYINFVTTNCSRIYCYTPDTEVLTKDGWKYIVDLTSQDILLTLNTNTNKAEWQQNQKLNMFEYSGETIRWKTNQFISPGFTPDHIQWAAKYDIRKNRGKNNSSIENYAKVTTKDIFNKRFIINHEIDLDNEIHIKNIKIGKFNYNAKKFFRFLGWMVTDGTISNKKNACIVYQFKEKNHQQLIELFNDLFDDRWNQYKHMFVIYDSDLKNWLMENIGQNKTKKRLYKLFNYSKELLNELYIGALCGDGNIHKTNLHKVIYCSYEDLAKDWQVILSRLGYSSNIRKDESRIGTERILNNKIIKHNLPSFIISIHNKSASLIKKCHQYKEEFDGIVYCPQTRNGIIFVRNQGMAFWSGNTHEQVRHRVGVAYSQTSGRYVSIDTLNIVLDPILHDALEEIEELRLVTETYLKKLRKKLIEDKNISDFATKKKITSAIRRLAPNGQSNELGWSANIRALRQMIEMRTSRHAEWEIRLIYNQVANILNLKFPLMLYGAEIENIDGLLEYSNLKV